MFDQNQINQIKAPVWSAEFINLKINQIRMKFFATVAAMACIAHGVFLENEADEAFEMWTA